MWDATETTDSWSHHPHDTSTSKSRPTQQSSKSCTTTRTRWSVVVAGGARSCWSCRQLTTYMRPGIPPQGCQNLSRAVAMLSALPRHCPTLRHRGQRTASWCASSVAMAHWPSQSVSDHRRLHQATQEAQDATGHRCQMLRQRPLVRAPHRRRLAVVLAQCSRFAQVCLQRPRWWLQHAALGATWPCESSGLQRRPLARRYRDRPFSQDHCDCCDSCLPSRLRACKYERASHLRRQRQLQR